MVMGILLSISGFFLYYLIKPPVPGNSFIQEETVFSKKPSVDFETSLRVPN